MKYDEIRVSRKDDSTCVIHRVFDTSVEGEDKFSAENRFLQPDGSWSTIPYTFYIYSLEDIL